MSMVLDLSTNKVLYQQRGRFNGLHPVLPSAKSYLSGRYEFVCIGSQLNASYIRLVFGVTCDFSWTLFVVFLLVWLCVCLVTSSWFGLLVNFPFVFSILACLSMVF